MNAYSEGWRAAREGWPSCACPYPENSEDALRWLYGHRAYREVIR